MLTCWEILFALTSNDEALLCRIWHSSKIESVSSLKLATQRICLSKKVSDILSNDFVTIEFRSSM